MMVLNLFDDEEVPPVAPKPPGAPQKEPVVRPLAPQKERPHPTVLTDEELLVAAPADEVGAGLWRIWRALHGIDRKLAKSYRTHDSVDRIALARLVNAILFGVESDRPEITPERVMRLTIALNHLPRYIAHLRVGTGAWEGVLRGML